MRTDWAEKFLFAAISLAFLGTAIFTNGIGDSGDSITHYLCSHFAPSNPSLFFFHWGKPFFTLLSAPFAAMGFTGIKVFNVLCIVAAAWFTIKTAGLTGSAHPWLAGILFMASPLVFPVMLSGLTEPLSALMMIATAYFWLNGKRISALVILSFLPFVRSEGLILMLVALVMLLWLRNWKSLPWLLTGHVVYSIAGYPFYHDILWVFTKIPYVATNTFYGKGTWTHFLEQLYFCLGPVVFLLFVIGAIHRIYLWFQLRRDPNTEELFLVHGMTVAFVGAHTCFWALGLFNSMGLNRVLVTVFPLTALIALAGVDVIVRNSKASWQLPIRIMLLLLVVGFPFTNNPAAIPFKKDATLSERHQMVKNEVAPFLNQNYPKVKWTCSDGSIALFTNRNFFDNNQWNFAGIGDPLAYVNVGEVIVYDAWHFPIESGITSASLDTMSGLKLVKTFALKDAAAPEFAIYEKH